MKATPIFFTFLFAILFTYPAFSFDINAVTIEAPVALKTYGDFSTETASSKVKVGDQFLLEEH